MMMLQPGSPAPQFTLEGTDGHPYALPRDTRGVPVLLVFFKTTCETCDLTFPYLNRLRETFPNGWSLWAVAQDPLDAATAYAARHAITYPVLVDAPGYDVSRLYDPDATPTLFLVSPEGRITYATHGFAKDDLNELARLIAGYVGGAPAIIAPDNDGLPPFRPG